MYLARPALPLFLQKFEKKEKLHDNRNVPATADGNQ
jgi:hypothetical protein